jgi:hypothetical protein
VRRNPSHESRRILFEQKGNPCAQDIQFEYVNKTSPVLDIICNRAPVTVEMDSCS